MKHQLFQRHLSQTHFPALQDAMLGNVDVQTKRYAAVIISLDRELLAGLLSGFCCNWKGLVARLWWSSSSAFALADFHFISLLVALLSVRVRCSWNFIVSGCFQITCICIFKCLNLHLLFFCCVEMTTLNYIIFICIQLILLYCFTQFYCTFTVQTF